MLSKLSQLKKRRQSDINLLGINGLKAQKIILEAIRYRMYDWCVLYVGVL